MGKLTAKMNVSNLDKLEDVGRYTTIALTNIADQINGNISLENLSVRIIPFAFEASLTTYVIPHGLGRVPAIWISGNIDTNAVVYQTQNQDINSLYLEASAICSARIFVI